MGLPWQRGLSLGVGVALLLSLAGCGRSIEPMPKTYPVTGIVTYPGGKPYSGGLLSLVPVDHDDGTFVLNAPIKDDGSFTVTTMRPGDNQKADGAAPGEYRVKIIPMMVGDQTQQQNPMSLMPIDLPRPIKIEAKDNRLPLELPAPRGGR